MRGLSGFACGLVFALGLGISGMTSPRKVVAFLDFSGRWDPSLALVMAGAVGLFAIGYALSKRRAAPLAGGAFLTPQSTRIEPRLIVGATLFGVGWGIAGYCPGPAIVALASGAAAPVVFTAAMVVGLALATTPASWRHAGVVGVRPQPRGAPEVDRGRHGGQAKVADLAD
jgi:uncharacterized membrane protein YedE/YeeE